MILWDKTDLNHEQLNAISETDNVYLVACPGSGKTRTLTYKIAKELIALESNKVWVVAITYTNRAADEIRERIELLGVDISQLWIGTIHAFCLEWIIKPYASVHPRLVSGFRVIDSYDTEQILDELCKPYASQKVSHYDCNYYYTTQGIVYSCEAGKQPVVGGVIEQYEAILAANNQINFEQILLYSYQILRNFPQVARTLSNLISYILIDEFQDTREIQYAIFCDLIKSNSEKVKVFIVGDPNQAIFGSLGGYAISLKELEERTNQSFKLLGLTKNYRSSKKIVSHFSHYRVFPSDIIASGEHSDYPSIVSYDKSIYKQELAASLARLIRYHIESEGIKENEVCIIAPWWIHIGSMTRALSSLLPEYSFNGPGLTPFSRDEDNFWYKLSRLLLTEPSPALYLRRLRWANDILELLLEYDVSVKMTKSKELLRLLNTINIKIVDGLQYLHEAFDMIAEGMGLEYRYSDILNEHHDAFFASARNRIGKIQKENAEYAGSIADFRNAYKKKSGITVSTIHGIKGAEFDVVLAYGLLQDIVPHFTDKEPHSAHKLIYVIGSRARKHLYLFSEKGRGNRNFPKRATNILSDHNFNYDRNVFSS
ncbi:UvrD-helicase domain-containing protein [Pseudoalteromonas gelatinilytica]